MKLLCVGYMHYISGNYVALNFKAANKVRVEEIQMKITVAGTGYVGLSLAVLLAQHNEVMAVDIIEEKVNLINQHKSPIQDEYIEKYLKEKELNLVATTDAETAYREAEFVVIATPTNYDSKKNFFDTSAVEAVIQLVMKVNPKAIMVIKSTIPVGYTVAVREKYHYDRILFSPEFLRESKALYDNLYQAGTCGGCPYLCTPPTAGSNQREHRYLNYGIYRG